MSVRKKKREKPVMEPNLSGGTNLKAGTLGGTIFVLFLQLKAGELIKTILLAMIGAIISYIVSACLKWLSEKFRKNH